MHEAVIVEPHRTPIGRYNGALKDIRPDDLAAHVIRAVVERSGLDPSLLEDVILGCTNQAGEDNRNVARMSALIAGLPVEVGGVTVNRLCASGLEAINRAAMAVNVGAGDVFIAGGVESMTRSPHIMLKPNSSYPRGDLALVDSTLGWRFVNPALAAKHHPFSMGETAENVAERYRISREDQDRFALGSQRKAAVAQAEGRFADEIVPIPVPAGRGEKQTIDSDEHPRPDLTLEALAKLRPVFREGGSVTAGNSSGINDGAAAMLVCSAEFAKAHGLRPIARVVSHAVAGVEPAYMGMGPVPATEKALKRASLRLDEIGAVELNEAFAAQSLAVVRELGISEHVLNPNGGAIALGHPLGCSGARLVTTLLHHMQRQRIRYGLATLCIGVGQGLTTVFERPTEWN
ncbi:MAG: pcaF [Chloroflexi bacterium]|nr:pcaF [Chloroflexota bacterium]